MSSVPPSQEAGGRRSGRAIRARRQMVVRATSWMYLGLLMAGAGWTAGVSGWAPRVMLAAWIVGLAVAEQRGGRDTRRVLASIRADALRIAARMRRARTTAAVAGVLWLAAGGAGLDLTPGQEVRAAVVAALVVVLGVDAVSNAPRRPAAAKTVGGR